MAGSLIIEKEIYAMTLTNIFRSGKLHNLGIPRCIAWKINITYSQIITI